MLDRLYTSLDEVAQVNRRLFERGPRLVLQPELARERAHRDTRTLKVSVSPSIVPNHSTSAVTLAQPSLYCPHPVPNITIQSSRPIPILSSLSVSVLPESSVPGIPSSSPRPIPLIRTLRYPSRTIQAHSLKFLARLPYPSSLTFSCL